jgi:hypothetical protein
MVGHEALLALTRGLVVADWLRAGGVEYGPDDLAAVGGGQSPERSCEPGDKGEALLMNLKT